MAINFNQFTLQSYLESEYILNSHQHIFRIGDLHHESERIFRSNGVHSYAWVTASNPQSIRMSLTENKIRMTKLKEDLKGQLFFDGLSRSQDGSWEEKGVWVCGLKLNTIKAIAKKYNQNAIAFAILGCSMKLILV